MKTKIKFMLVALMATVIFSSCERVAPNYAGVLMENYGKEGKEDFKIVSGKVSTWEWGTELFQVPLFEQRGGFQKSVTLKQSSMLLRYTHIELSKTRQLTLFLIINISETEMDL